MSILPVNDYDVDIIRHWLSIHGSKAPPGRNISAMGEAHRHDNN
jgi:hypothetical protein